VPGVTQPLDDSFGIFLSTDPAQFPQQLAGPIERPLVGGHIRHAFSCDD
jgi:hypothetical protein